VIRLWHLPQHRGRHGETWSFWPWVVSDLAGLWLRFDDAREAEDVARALALGEFAD